ncbi:hypothetical protein [Microbispora sp. ATCC PTA-5024]|uniref:hypothetical protein n=1 Tax=Microbispora sp. ATCC PTA-5024 TaxID=316330 RepID=UPI0003DCD6B7|nr:hypothetical protein [Microbispora sp. ATCC PTA-5024]ETK33646.1 hypothetical protein MPTA5024_23705 [Microbispora sp. ATCC PTA-5024]
MPQRRAPRHNRPDSGLDLDSRGVRIGLGAVVTLVFSGGLLAARSETGAQYLAEAQAFLTYYAGVVSLVALTTTVALGLVATDRVVLPIRHRVAAQLVHRAAALIGVGFLVVHIGMKIAAGLVPAYGSVVPSTNLYVGMGAVASDLMIVVITTGVMRGRFAQAERPWAWRIVHDLAYLAWPLSILHGLAAGRAPAAWVSWSYVVCLVAVGAALLLRVVAAARPARAPKAEQREQRPARTTLPRQAPQAVPRPVSVLRRTGTDDAAAGAAARRPQDTRLRRIV